MSIVTAATVVSQVPTYPASSTYLEAFSSVLTHEVDLYMHQTKLFKILDN